MEWKQISEMDQDRKLTGASCLLLTQCGGSGEVVLLVCFETESLYVALAVLELCRPG